MSVCWRLTPVEFASSAFTGEGARVFGGRWNEPGVAVVYTSESRSLATLEALVHLGQMQPFPPMYLLEADVPDSLILSVEDLSSERVDVTNFGATVATGSGWARSAASVGLWVPSAVVASERNLLLNPAHPEFDRVRVGAPSPFSFDPRLLR